MRPRDFLQLAAPLVQWSDEYDATLDWMVDRIQKGENLELPWLVISDRSAIGLRCEVVGHEGRHRMNAAKLAGIEKVPVVIKLKKVVKHRDEPVEYVTTNPNVDEQNCIQCGHEDAGEAVCRGMVQAEVGLYDKGRVIEEGEGPIRGVAFERLPIDWCQIPEVKNATSDWREAQGIVLDCD